MIYQAFFDESGSHAGARVLTIGSYTFLKHSASKFTQQWGKKLIGHGISCSHMTDCVTGNGEYRHMSKDQRLLTEIDLIDAIKAYSLFGTGISIDIDHFERAMNGKQHVYGPYTLLLLLTVERISSVLRVRDTSAKISYIFENGHKSASEAHKFMSSIDRFGGLARQNYQGHSFARKEESLPLQAADMIAWQVRHFLVRKEQGYTRQRKDFAALIRPQDTFSEVSNSQIDWFAGLVAVVDPLGTKGPFELLERIQNYVARSGPIQGA